MNSSFVPPLSDKLKDLLGFDAVYNGSEFRFISNYTLIGFKDNERKKGIPSIVAYSVILLFGAIGNARALFRLLKRRQRKKPTNTFMVHLTVADLLVVFLTIPIEIVWRLTISWDTGLVGCKVMQTLRAFGLYLSSMMLISISIERYHAFVVPVLPKVSRARNRRCLAFSWISSIVLSFPQAVIYHLDNHPYIHDFEQCVAFNYFVQPWMESFYNIVCLTGMYFGPLLVILFCYFNIFRAIQSEKHILPNRSIETSSGRRRSTCRASFDLRSENSLDSIQTEHQSVVKVCRQTALIYQLQKGSVTNRAKRRTLSMTLIIVVAFVICWTPYAVMVLYYTFDSESAQQWDPLVTELLYIFGVANACVNPFVYSMNLVRISG